MARMAPDAPALSVVVPLPQQKQLSLLGGFRLALGDEPVSIPASAQRLVGLVALSLRPASRALVAATLWPESSEARAGSSLRSAVWRVRRSAPWLLDAQDDLELANDVYVDIREARALGGRLADQSQVHDEELDLMPFLLDPLPDWYDDWVIVERERYRQTRLHALEALCDLLVARGRYARAIEAGQAAVEGEPLRETAHRTLIRAHLAEGNVSEALRQYRFYRRLLRDELGVRPSPELESLVAVGSR